MNSRDLTIFSTASFLGALVSALTIRFFLNPRKHLSASNGVVGAKSSNQSPFDPAKRKGLVHAWLVKTVLYLVRSDKWYWCLRVLTFEVMLIIELFEYLITCIGYNGFPRGCSDDKLPWSKKSKTGDPLETKYPYVCHAEVNAILNTNHASAAGQRLYVTMFPCNECAKIIIQSGVSEVVYYVEKRLENSESAYVASHKLLSMAGVKVRRHQPRMDQILIKFDNISKSVSSETP
uniref:dCMP deaminase n=1 Tax=Daucus carota subsp. sativus TaxID=79200 RepID=A0A164XGC8_DAUCS